MDNKAHIQNLKEKEKEGEEEGRKEVGKPARKGSIFENKEVGHTS